MAELEQILNKNQLLDDSNLNPLDILKEMQQYGTVCDAVLRTKDRGKFQVHRPVMVACSPYFEALFNSPVNREQRREIIIPDITANMFRKIVQFAYTRRLPINIYNVYEQIKIADQFLVFQMLDMCCQFLIDQINDKTCIGIWKFSKLYNCKVTETKAHKYLLANFASVVKGKEYLELSLNEIIEILNFEELNVKSEEFVWESILVWINGDPIIRSKHISQLMTCARLGLMDPEYFIEKVKHNKYVMEDNNCRQIIIDAIKCLFDLEVGQWCKSKPKCDLQRPRLPYELLFVIGGWNGEIPTNLIESYDIKTDSWMMLAFEDPSGPRAYHRCATVDHCIYVIGGYDGIEFFNTCRCFDVIKATWKEIAPMYSHRCYVSVAVIDRIIYAIGGYNGQERQKTAERYNCDINQWEMIAPMNKERSDASASELRGYIYIVGGFNGSEFLNSAEFYNPKTNQWTSISSMKTRRSGVCCISYNGFLYVFGGFNGISRLSSGEMYNPDTEKWYPLPDMNIARSNFATVVLEDLIFVLGGFNGVITISNVECYDIKGEQWIQAEEMHMSRSALDACVVKNIPNIKDYIPPRNEAIFQQNIKLWSSSREIF